MTTLEEFQKHFPGATARHSNGVDRVEFSYGGFEVVVNRYNGDNNNLQLLLDHPDGHSSVHTVPLKGLHKRLYELLQEKA